MNEQARGVFLCPDCGNPSTVDEAGQGQAVCSHCETEFSIPEQAMQRVVPSSMRTAAGAIQRNIPVSQKASSPKFQAPEKKSVPIPTQEAVVEGESALSQPAVRQKHLKKRNQLSAKFYLRWVLVWIIAVVTILSGVYFVQQHFDLNVIVATTTEESLHGEEKEFYRKEYPKIIATFNNYLGSGAVTDITATALDVTQLERKINRYLKDRILRRPVAGLKSDPAFWNVAFEERPGFVEVVWDGKDGESFEAVFSKVGDGWKLDWEQHVRYGDLAWTVFKQKIGSQRSGVFRVLVEKVSEEEDSESSSLLKVRLLPPYSDLARQRGEVTEVIELDGSGEVGARIAQMFVDRAGQSAGYSELWKRDPKEHRRALLRLAWEPDAETEEDVIVIKEVLADHWRAIELES